MNNLTELYIGMCDSEILKGFENVKFVRKLSVGRLDENMLEIISGFSDLEELYMEYTGLSDLNILKNNKKLRKMTIGVSCTNITLESMKELNQLEEVYFYPDSDENKIEELRSMQNGG